MYYPVKTSVVVPSRFLMRVLWILGGKWKQVGIQKRSKNEAAGSSLEALGGLPGLLGSVLDRLRGILGSESGQRRGERQLLGVSWAVLGASWGHLGAPRGHLGVSWGPKWCLDGAKYRYKNQSKKLCLSRSFFDAILVEFGRENGSKLAPKTSKNRSRR